MRIHCLWLRRLGTPISSYKMKNLHVLLMLTSATRNGTLLSVTHQLLSPHSHICTPTDISFLLRLRTFTASLAFSPNQLTRVLLLMPPAHHANSSLSTLISLDPLIPLP